MKKLIVLILVIATMSCSKSSSTGNDDQPPVVIITAPTANQRFNAGQTVDITGTLTDNETLAELHVHISNRETGALLIDIHRYPSASSYEMKESFQAQAGILYRVQVIAKDNSANEGRASVEISTN
ncbi:Ig-like domain-containing protein [Terrimonas sp. NA20]|uniref:Ig-like domain-containing protein n=1 Tax=Terrimonas ginsenosidimutans TaxID=2908004 RepID=A0ABS9KQV9_9BACT|nr:Ig-like domain-containing protein [Terrimonas ginsenosidimutans]MCG2614701.1 Ig-like domain-containing protein [Terrimonas ginsenosidimutans]